MGVRVNDTKSCILEDTAPKGAKGGGVNYHKDELLQAFERMQETAKDAEVIHITTPSGKVVETHTKGQRDFIETMTKLTAPKGAKGGGVKFSEFKKELNRRNRWNIRWHFWGLVFFIEDLFEGLRRTHSR